MSPRRRRTAGEPRGGPASRVSADDQAQLAELAAGQQPGQRGQHRAVAARAYRGSLAGQQPIEVPGLGY
ncbi:hypothetical protein EAS64_29005 [Trebonia kvetii]|uniref:Uncharacterized protein n=1 Tax=Trebonia kvetii TaxID=2480626 RepID=A0A6P2BR33_9ACTN|nr:hypothetical protein [Trebonia kvetii]TVZ01539.1 hypothetical protein EAS64_29005 [Trebonia kvetii]